MILMALILLSCTREQVSDVREGEMTITAGFESWTPDDAASRTYVAGGTEIRWSSAAIDKVLYVFDTKGVKNVFTSTESGAAATRAFSGTISPDASVRYVLWSGKSAGSDRSGLAEIAVPSSTDELGNEPIGAGGEISFETKSGDGATRTVITGSSLEVVNPQTINNTGSFAQDANISVMKPGDTALRSVFGMIRYTIPAGDDGCATIKSVTFSADEDLAGEIRIDYSGQAPTAAIIANGSPSLTVNTRWSGKIPGYEAGTLYAVLPEGVYHNFKVTVTPFEDGASTQDAATGEPYTLSSKGDVIVKRGCYTDAGTLNRASTPDPEQVLGEVKQILTGSVGAVCIEGNALYTGQGGTMMTYDISEPFSPTLSSTLPMCGSPRQIVAYQGKLYVTARETGVWIFDITDPLHPTFLTRYDSVELATGVDVAGDCLFVGQRQNGVEFIDITNPSAPAHIRMLKTNESQSVFYRNGYLYSGEWGAGKVTIFDARDLSDIKILKQINLQGYGDGLWISGNRLYASTGHHHRNQTPSTVNGDGHGVEIWDVSDPVNPVFISRTEFDIFYKSGTDCWMNRPSGDGKTLFCGDVYNGLYILDITDETHPQILEHYTPGANTAVTCVALGDGVIYVTASNGGLQAIQCSRSVRSTRERGALPANASARYDYATPSGSHFRAWKPSVRGAVRSAAAWGDALFVGCANAGLAIVKLDGSGVPYTYSTLNLPFAGGVAVRGNRLYVSLAQDGVGVYKISEGPVLTRIATVKSQLSTRTNEQYSCWVSAPNDKYLVNGARNAGYQFLSIGGTEDAPIFTYRAKSSLNVNYNKFIPEQVCGGDYLPYATRSGLIWINLSSTTSATVSSAVEDIKNGLSDGVTNFKDGNALITANGGFYLVEPGASTILTTSGANGGFGGTPRWDGGDQLIISHFLGLYVTKANLANVSSPVLQFKETTEGHPEPGLFWNGKAVVPCGYQGLLIEK
jgi:hypothetical protein